MALRYYTLFVSGAFVMARKPDDWMPLRIGKYLQDTSHLTREQHGGYFLLLMAYWSNGGPLLDNDARLAAITKATASEWKRLRPVLAEFFLIEDGFWHQKRADHELAKARTIVSERSRVGKLGADARWQTDAADDGKGMANGMAKASQTDSNTHGKSMDLTTLLPGTSYQPVTSEEESTNQKKKDCSEPEKGSQPPSPIFISMPCNRAGQETPVTAAQIAEYETTFPAVDVKQELREIRAWLVANSTKRKTAKGMPAFIFRWLSKEQDKGHPNGDGRSRRPTAHDNHLAGIRLAIEENERNG